MYDSLNMHSLESSLIDIMRAEQDPMKSKASSSSFKSASSGREGGRGQAIMFAQEASAVRRREVTGHAAPGAVLIFHAADYFLPCSELHTCAHQLRLYVTFQLLIPLLPKLSNNQG